MKSLKREFSAFVALLTFVICVNGFPQASPTSSARGSANKAPNKKSRFAQEDEFHEDWNSLTLESSNLAPQPPVPGGANEYPADAEFVRQRFQMQWRPYDPFDLYVIRPKGVPKPPVILYLYSWPQDTGRFMDPGWCTTATSGGFAAVGFVSAMTGHRSGVHPPKQWFVSELQESLATSAHDVQMILNYLAGRGDLDMDHVGMLGQGSGGTIAILASAADPRIRAVDVLTPWGDWPNWVAKSPIVPADERARYTTPEFLAHVASLDPLEWLPKVKAQRLRIQNVRKSLVMPDDSQEKMEAAAPQFAEINQYGDGRAFFPHGGALFDWVKEQIKPDAAPMSVANKSDRVHFYPAPPGSERKALP